MKRAVILILILSLCLGLCACGKASPAAAPETPAPSAEPTPEPTTEPTPEPENEPEPEIPDLRFDGLYCRIADGYNDTFRFFEDETVVCYGVTKDYVPSGFPNERCYSENPPIYPTNTGYFKLNKISGYYKVNDDALEFSVDDGHGTSDYWGKICDGYLILNAHYNVSGNEYYDLKYDFIPFDEIPGWYD